MARLYQFPQRQRTEAEIMAQLRDRYAELEAEKACRDADPEILYPCKTCRWRSYNTCKNALVVGFSGGKMNWDAGYSSAHSDAALCGPEKALWQPLTWWGRNKEWMIVPACFFAPFAAAGAVIGVAWLFV